MWKGIAGFLGLRPADPPAGAGVGTLPDLHDGLVLVNASGRILDVNAAVVAMFGHTRDALIGRDLLVLVPSYGEEHVGVARWRRTSRGEMLGTVWNLEAQHADGGRFPVELSFQKVAGPQGLRFLYALRDAAQDRLADGAQRSKDALLDEVRHEAMEARRAKARFLANMSHELRTPLNAIIGYAEILHEDAPGPLKPDCDRILRASARLRHLVENVLELSRLDTGREYVFVETFSLAEVVRRTVAEVEPLAEQNGNRVEVDLHPKVDRMRSDAAKVHQIVHHLLENACRFTERGRVTVKVGFADEGGEVVIEVSDTGIGIPLVHRDSVFEAFEVADRSTRRLVGGAGLGLAIARGYAQLLGGSLTLAERRDGCAFQLRLPLDAGVADDEPAIDAEDEAVLLYETGEVPSRAAGPRGRLATPSPPEVRATIAKAHEPAAPSAAAPAAFAHGLQLGMPALGEPPAPAATDGDPAAASAEDALPSFTDDPTDRIPLRRKRRRRKTLVPAVPETDAIAKGPRILVLDRAGPSRDSLERALREAGHRTMGVADGRQAVYLASALSPAAMVVNPGAPDVEELLERASDDVRVGMVPIVFAAPGQGGWFLPASATLARSASMARFRSLLSTFVVRGGRALVLAEPNAERESLGAVLAGAGMSVHAHDRISRELYAIEWDLVLTDPSLPDALAASRLCSATGTPPVVVLLPSPLDDESGRRFRAWMKAQPGAQLTADGLVGRVRALTVEA